MGSRPDKNSHQEMNCNNVLKCLREHKQYTVPMNTHLGHFQKQKIKREQSLEH